MTSVVDVSDPHRADKATLHERLRSLVSSWHLRFCLAGLIILCVLLLLRGFYRRELFHFAGDAQWMWCTSDVLENRPTAALFVTVLRLHGRPLRAVAKVCGERQYVLWVNGQPAMAGRNRPSFRLDVVPITDLLAAGDNVIAIEARSHTSVGAVLFALDLFPGAEGRRAGDPRGRSVLVSGPDWRVIDEWGRGPEGLEPSAGRPPWIWGRPPDHPWTYPPPQVHSRAIVQAVISDPLQLAGGDFELVGPGLWMHRLDRFMSGFLWIDLDAGLGNGEVWIGPADDAGAGLAAQSAAVVSLPGQRRWLFPGWFEGDTVVVRGAKPPASAQLVEGLGGSIESQVSRPAQGP